MEDWMQKALDGYQPDEKDLAVTPPPADDWMGAAIDGYKQETDAKINNIVDFSVTKNPDVSADDQKIAKKLGVNTDDVEVNRESAKAEYQKSFLYNSFEKSPTLKERFQANPDFALVAHDDHENLAKLDEKIKKIRKAYEDQEAPLTDIVGHGITSAPDIWRSQIAGGVAAYHNAELQELYKERNRRKEGKEYGILDRLERFAYEVIPSAEIAAKARGVDTEQAKKASRGVYQRMDDDELERTIGIYEQNVEGALDEAEQLKIGVQKKKPFTHEESPKYYAGEIVSGTANMAPSMAVAYITRGKVGAALGGTVIGGQVFGETYAEEIKKHGDHEKAVSSGVYHMATEGIGEMVPLGFLTSKGGKALTRMLKQAGAEGIQEMVTEALNIGYEEAWVRDDMTFADAMKVLFTDDEKRAEIFKRMRVAGITGAGVGGTMAAVTQPFHSIEEAKINKEKEAFAKQKEQEASLLSANAEETKNSLIEIGDAVKETKLHARSPEALNEFVQAAAKEGSGYVYIDIDEFVGYWQSAKEGEIETIMDSIEGVNAQIEDAMISGGDIKIPVSEYATKIAPTEHNAGLAEIARLRQEDVSASQVNEAVKEQESSVEKEGERIKFNQSADIVKSLISDEITKTGKFGKDVADKYAALHSAFAKMVAKETGVLPHEAYEKYAIKVQAAKTGEGYSQPPVYKAAESAIKKSGMPKGTAKQWKEVLGKAPVETVKWLDTKKGEVSKQEVMENIKQNIASEQLLFQEKRGTISFGRGIDSDAALISLLENADLSTFLHESGHYFFEVMNDLAIQPEASEQLKKDLETLVKFAGVESIEKWNQMSLEQKRAGHEKVADAFEDYLMEGKSPSAELKKVFQRFRDWLLEVYKSITRQAQLTDDVRQVFDRMLASQESIDAANKARRYQAMYDSAEQAGWTDEVFKKYIENIQGMSAEAKDKLQTRLIRDMKWFSGAKHRKIAQLQAEATEKRNAIKAEVTAEVNELPVYKLINTIKSKEVKLNIGMLKEMYPAIPEEAGTQPRPEWEKLGYGKSGMLAEDGMNPNIVAELHNYASAEAMINEILSTKQVDQAIAEETDRRMFEEYGDITSPKKLEQAANEALHNAIRERVLDAEYAAIAAVTGAPRFTSKAAKAYAEKTIASMKVRDIRPSVFENEENSAAKKAEKAMFDGDIQKAGESKLQEMVSAKKFKVSILAQAEIEKHREYLKKFSKESIRKSIGADYIEQIDDIIVKFDIRKNVPLYEVNERKSLKEWIDAQEEMGFEPDIDDRFIEEAKKKYYKDMTLDELREVIDAVKNIETLGRNERQLLLDKDKREFKERMDALRDSIKANANREVELGQRDTDVIGGAEKGWDEFASDHRAIGSIIYEMDGQKYNGEMFNTYWVGLHKAGIMSSELTSSDNHELAKMFDSLGKLKGTMPLNLRTKKIAIKGTNLSMTHENMVMFGVYWGDEQGRQRILQNGIDGKRPITEKEAAAVIDMLTESDLSFIKGVWELNESKRPAIAEQEKRLTGKEPKWVKPAPYVTKHGVMPGGYHSLMYNSDISASSEKEAAIHVKNSTTNIRNYATRHSYAEKRVDAAKGKVLDLTFETITRHLSEVNHRLSYQDWLTNARRIIKAQEDVIREHYGPNILRQFTQLHKDTADGFSTRMEHGGEKISMHIRSGTVIANMAWNFTVAALQPSGLSISWEAIGTKWIAKGLKETAVNNIKAAEKVRSLSSYMKHRWESTFMREMNERLNQIRAGKAEPTIFEIASFRIIAMMQMSVDIPTWLGAYEKALDTLKIQMAQNEEQRTSIREKASLIADKTIEDTQGSGLDHSMARIMKGGPAWKLFTMFGNYFVTVYNRNVLLYRRTKFTSPASILSGIGDFLLINTLPALFSTILYEALKGDCEWDSECLAKKASKEQVSYMFGQMMLVRELSASFQEFLSIYTEDQTYGYKGPAGTKWFTDMYRLAQEVKQEDEDGIRKQLIAVLGVPLKLPSAQINRTWDGIVSWYEGDSGPMAPLAGPKK